jgi:hypothetical protein
MRNAEPKRSWWQAFGDFIQALDRMEDYASYKGLAARVAQLERRVAELEPVSKALASPRKEF